MATSRPFAYNTGSAIQGTVQVGNIAIGYPTAGFESTGLRWWEGPNEDLGYVIAKPISAGNQPNPLGVSASIAFSRSESLDDASFISVASNLTGQNFSTGAQAKTWLNANGFWTSYESIITTGLKLRLDAGDVNSYSGTGTTWYDISGNGNNVDMQNSGSISWTDGGIGYFTTVGNGWFTKSSTSGLPTGNSSYTLSVWVKLGSSWSGQGMMSIGPFGNGNEANAFRTGNTNNIINYWWGNDLAVNTAVSPADSWFNAVAKYNGTTRSIWINGSSVGFDTPSGHNVTTSALQIAKTYNTEYLNGNIAQALIYDVALSDSEILQNFNSTKSRFGL